MSHLFDVPSADAGIRSHRTRRALGLACVVESLERRALLHGGDEHGLNATYFDNINFTGPTVSRVDAQVNFSWGNGSPAPGIGVDTFSARWEGKVRPDFTGTYTFFTQADDGVRLWVDGVQIINNWQNQATTERSGTRSLVAGVEYDIRMEYYENAGGAVAKLLWSGPSTSKQIIPTTNLIAGAASNPPPFAAKINFQPASASAPAGFLVDGGSAFSARSNGFTYGWDASNTVNARDRNNAASSNQAYDTLNHMQLGGSRTWEIAVPNGTYAVKLVAGDPSNFDSVYKINIEGTLAVNGVPSTSARWFEGNVTVNVADGKLTIANAGGAVNNKIAFLEIASTDTVPPPPPPPPPPPAGQSPYLGAPFAIPTTIQAEDFDNGGSGVAFNDINTQNKGNAYRSTAVDIRSAGTGHVVGWTSAGEWLEYTINVPASGNYLFEVSAAAGYNAGTFRVEFDGVDKTSAIQITNTGGWNAWKTFSKTVNLSAGQQIMRFFIISGLADGAGDVDYFRFTAVSNPVPSNEFAWTTLAPSPIGRSEFSKAVVGEKIYIFGGFSTGDFKQTALSHVYNTTTNAWSQIKSLPSARNHTGVAEDGNDIYIAAGFLSTDNDTATSEVLRYNVIANEYYNFTPLPEARAGGALVRIGRNLHYIGGTISYYVQDRTNHWVINIDNPSAGWQSLAPLPVGRNHLGYAAMDGQIYIVGGQSLQNEWGGNSGRLDRYNPSSNTWTQLASLPRPRGHVSESVFVSEGRLFVVGGVTNLGERLSDFMMYDPVTNVWSKLTDIPEKRMSMGADFVNGRIYAGMGYADNGLQRSGMWSATLAGTWETRASIPNAIGEVAGGIIGNRMYLLGESNVQTFAFNLSTDTWSTVSTRQFVGHHHAAEVYNGRLYLFGGLGGSSEGKVQIYNPSTNSWTLGGNMPFAAGSSSSTTIGEYIYVAGGIVSGSTTTQAARYHPATNTWQSISSMPAGRNHAASATDGQKFYVFGGRGPGSGDSNTVANGFANVQIYNPLTNTWTDSANGSGVAPLPQARGGTGKAVYFGGEFYILGGETLSGAGATAQGVYGRVDIYNPATNTWRLGTPMVTPRHGIFPILHADRIYVAGGGVVKGYSSSSVLEILNLL